MAYNPVLDLLFGIFLIAVPLLVLSGLIFVLVFHKPEDSRNLAPEDRGDEWEFWVRRTLDQAYGWRGRMTPSSPDGPETSNTHGAGDREKLEEIIHLLENMKNGETRPVQMDLKEGEE